MTVPWRRIAEVGGWSAVLFAVLPFLITAFGGKFSDGVLIGTGVAIVWYTLETLELRRETARLRHETAQQSELAAKHNDIALAQAEAAIRPLLVSRVEVVEGPYSSLSRRLVLRNIGHGPALFVRGPSFSVHVWTCGRCEVALSPLDLIEPGQIGVPEISVQGAPPGPKPESSHVVASLEPDGVHASADSIITITYDDVQHRRFESMMQMGKDGTRLLRLRRLDDKG